MNRVEKVYFSHPASTHQMGEQKGQHYIRILFPHHTLVSPYHKLNAECIKRKASYATTLVSQSDVLVFMPYGDGKIDTTMRKEIEAMQQKGGEVHELSVEQNGRPTGMCILINHIDAWRFLTEKETLDRNQASAQPSTIRR